MTEGGFVPAARFTRDLAELCTRLLPACGPQVADRLRAVRSSLAEPARLVLLGPRGAGKSTLVNALLGRRIARCDSSVSTTLVSVYRHGSTDRVQLVRHDGQRAELRLTPAGELPAELGTPAAEVSFLDVQVAAPGLRDLTLVDTPGPVDRRPAGRDPVTGPVPDDLDPGSVVALSAADAVVCVYREPVGRDEQSAIDTAEAVLDRFGNGRNSTLGVLAGIDRLGRPGGNTGRLAEYVGEQQSALLGRVMYEVAPVAGLLAQAGSCGVGPALFAALRHAADLPADGDRPGSAPQLDSLGDYGVRLAGSVLARTPDLTEADLAVIVRRASGLQRVCDCLHTHVVLRRDELKRRRAVSELERVAANAPVADRELLRDDLECLLRRTWW